MKKYILNVFCLMAAGLIITGGIALEFSYSNTIKIILNAILLIVLVIELTVLTNNVFFNKNYKHIGSRISGLCSLVIALIMININIKDSSLIIVVGLFILLIITICISNLLEIKLNKN